ncbi:hypothetical protein [Candidatus Binatus sp.]|uniref:hypothetical protein n=1 Tax=Candidatus Binatus sp. TaxID=2811406 RepID=UPI003CC5D454
MLLEAQKIAHLNRPRQRCFEANIAKCQHSVAAGMRVLERITRIVEGRRTTLD